MKKLIYAIAILLASKSGFGQFIAITNQSSIYSENFNTLSTSGTAQTTLPAGWWINELPGNTTYRAGDGSANSGDTYSFGTGTNSERCLGGLASNSVAPNFGVKYINNSGASFTSFSINMFMEQWRSGGRTGLDSLYFYYSVNNSLDTAGTAKIFTGTWTRVPACDLVSKVTLASATTLDGNQSANRAYYQFTVSSLTVNVGDTLWLRWQDPNVGGSDDGLSIDDYSFTVAGTLPVKWNNFTAYNNNNNTTLNWSTASEINNNYFEVERSLDAKNYTTIGKVKGNGNTNIISNYQFIDNTQVSTTVYYRLKQVDFDGKFTYSDIVKVSNDNQLDVVVGPNPFSNEIKVTSNQNISAIEVIDVTGKVCFSSNPNSLNYSFKLDNMNNGVYFIRVNNGEQTISKRIIKN
ncbi:MAG: T9SS type A sorting domain-containing protein [Bacteroidota bacterium]